MIEGPADWRSAHNALVEAVEALQRLSASPPLALEMVAGTPRLRLTELPSGGGLRLGKTETDILGGDSGAVAIWRWNGSAFEATDEMVTAYNFFSSQVSGQRRVLLCQSLDDDLYYILAEDCSYS